MPLTKSQINKLGDDLRHLSPLDPIPEPALVRLQEFRSLYDGPLVEAQTMIKDRLGLETTSRLKTVDTILESFAGKGRVWLRCRTSPVCASSSTAVSSSRTL